MPHSFGYRARTRQVFSRPFRKNGILGTNVYLTQYKIGDDVTIKVNANIHSGMPHKIFHGKTGKVWTVTPRAVGVAISKRVRGRIVMKKMHVRIEHVQKSRCREEFLQRARANSKIVEENKNLPKEQRKPLLKRVAAQPRPGYTLKLSNIVDVVPPEFVETA
ncbi:hypothetical protein ABK040_000933 [Willaertia magna]